MRHWFGSAPHALLVFGLAVLCGPVSAQTSDADAALCEAAIVEGAGGVPQEVLHAISLTETGRPDGGTLRPWPWAINREGQGHWFKTREAALAFARHSLAEGRRSFDVGCFQINYKYHGHNFPSLEAMFDPATGAAYAARFLGDLYLESGDWSVAAGSYHSRTPHYARIYRARFDRIFQTVAGTPLIVAEAPETDGAPRRSRTKMSRGPLIIRIEPRRPDDGLGAESAGRMARLKAERIEKLLPVAAPADDAGPTEAAEAEVPADGWSPASGRLAAQAFGPR